MSNAFLRTICLEEHIGIDSSLHGLCGYNVTENLSHMPSENYHISGGLTFGKCPLPKECNRIIQRFQKYSSLGPPLRPEVGSVIGPSREPRAITLLNRHSNKLLCKF